MLTTRPGRQCQPSDPSVGDHQLTGLFLPDIANDHEPNDNDHRPTDLYLPDDVNDHYQTDSSMLNAAHCIC
jgi:hypothetical protein